LLQLLDFSSIWAVGVILKPRYIFLGYGVILDIAETIESELEITLPKQYKDYLIKNITDSGTETINFILNTDVESLIWRNAGLKKKSFDEELPKKKDNIFVSFFKYILGVTEEREEIERDAYKKWFEQKRFIIGFLDNSVFFICLSDTNFNVFQCDAATHEVTKKFESIELFDKYVKSVEENIYQDL
jgi:hypothetical protein